MTNSLAFTKSLRLLNSSAYQGVFDQPDIRVSSKHCLFLARFNELEYPRLGLVISKKNIRLAVQRNRIKRHLRESFRVKQHLLPKMDVVVLTRKGLDALDDKEMVLEFDKLWHRLSKQANKSEN